MRVVNDAASVFLFAYSNQLDSLGTRNIGQSRLYITLPLPCTALCGFYEVVRAVTVAAAASLTATSGARSN